MIEKAKIFESEKGTQNLLEKAGYEIIYLIACSLHGMEPQKGWVKQIDFSDLYKMANKHSLTAIVCMELEYAGILSSCNDHSLVKEWKDSKDKAIRKNMLMGAETKEISSFMEKKGIWYMPLKGIILQDMYPKFGMRQMVDNDILYDKQYKKEMFDFMTERGYRFVDIEKENHHIYMKAPVYNYELHTALYCAEDNIIWDKYYSNVKKRLIKDKGNQMGYHFSDEDLYIYITTHSYNHYKFGGTGIRSLLDTYLFLQQKGKKLNWDYIGTELKKLHIKEFELESRELSKKIFSKRPYQLTEKESEILKYYIESGTHGTKKNKIEKNLKRYNSDQKDITILTKIKYYFRRLIPNKDYYKNLPLLEKNKWIIPFFLVFRVIKTLVRNSKRILKEIKLVQKI